MEGDSEYNVMFFFSISSTFTPIKKTTHLQKKSKSIVVNGLVVVASLIIFPSMYKTRCSPGLVIIFSSNVYKVVIGRACNNFNSNTCCCCSLLVLSWPLLSSPPPSTNAHSTSIGIPYVSSTTHTNFDNCSSCCFDKLDSARRLSSLSILCSTTPPPPVLPNRFS